MNTSALMASSGESFDDNGLFSPVPQHFVDKMDNITLKSAVKHESSIDNEEEHSDDDEDEDDEDDDKANASAPRRKIDKAKWMEVEVKFRR